MVVFGNSANVVIVGVVSGIETLLSHHLPGVAVLARTPGS
jgi:hypothetical protein